MKLFRIIVFTDMVERDEFLVIGKNAEDAEKRFRNKHKYKPESNVSIMTGGPITQIDEFEIKLEKRKNIMTTSQSRKLETIQTKENLNSVYSSDEIGPGGAYHEYKISRNDNGNELTTIKFQNGPRKESNSTHGVLDGDLLEIVRDRMTSFQNGPFASEYNAEALMHIEEALKALNRRVEDRISRNVLGKNIK